MLGSRSIVAARCGPCTGDVQCLAGARCLASRCVAGGCRHDAAPCGCQTNADCPSLGSGNGQNGPHPLAAGKETVTHGLMDRGREHFRRWNELIERFVDDGFFFGKV